MPKSSKKNNLHLDFDETESYEDIYVIAILVPVFPLHRLAYFLNKNLDWHLSRTEDHKEGYGMLMDHLEADNLKVYLLANKAPEPWIAKESHVDYFLVFNGAVEAYPFDELIQTILGIESIFSAYPMPASKNEEMVDFISCHIL